MTSTILISVRGYSKLLIELVLTGRTLTSNFLEFSGYEKDMLTTGDLKASLKSLEASRAKFASLYGEFINSPIIQGFSKKAITRSL